MKIKSLFASLIMVFSISIISCSNNGGHDDDIRGLEFHLSADELSYSISAKDKNITSIVVPAAYNNKPVVGIDDRGFESCSSLTSIVLPDSIKSIGRWAFSLCSSLTSIVIPKGVSWIDSSTFFECSSLTSAVIQKGVTSIGSDAFYECTSLASIVLPKDVTSIGLGAFYGCRSLGNVFYEGTKIQWDSIAISPSNEGTLLNAHIEFETTREFTYINDGKYSYALDNLNNAYGLKAVSKEIVTSNIPEDLAGKKLISLAYEAFYKCVSLSSIILPESLTLICGFAFRWCKSLTSIIIPESVDFIGVAAFESCTSLSSIILPKNLTSIRGYCFEECAALTSIIIPKGVTFIGDYAFQTCVSLSSIVLPESLKEIYSGAFKGCYNLKDIYYDGSAETWDSIFIYLSDNDYLVDASRYYYSETKPIDTTYNYWHYVDNVPTAW